MALYPSESEKINMKSIFQKITVQKVVKGFRYLKHYGWKEFIIRLQEKMEAENIPYEPWYEKHKATAEQIEKQKKQAEKWNDAPKISIVVPLFKTPETFLRAMIESVQAQTYGNWQLCLADGSGAGDEDADPKASLVQSIANEYASADARIRYECLTENQGIAGNTNAAIALADGDWIAFMDHDDLLAPDALFEMVKMIRQGFHDEDGLAATAYREAGNDYEMLYTDEDKVDMDGKTHFQPHLKPDFNIDLLRSNNYITHFLAVKRSLLDQVGGIRSDFDGAQDYDFILRCAEQAGAIGHIPRILYHWRCHKESTSENPFSKQYAVDAGKRAIGEHLKRLGVAAFALAFFCCFRHIPKGVEIVYGDLTDKTSLEKFFDVEKEQIICIHCASIVYLKEGRSELVYRVNVEGTRNVIDLCLKKNVEKLVYVSSTGTVAELPHGQLMREPEKFDLDKIVGYYGKT